MLRGGGHVVVGTIFMETTLVGVESEANPESQPTPPPVAAPILVAAAAAAAASAALESCPPNEPVAMSSAENSDFVKPSSWAFQNLKAKSTLSRGTSSDAGQLDDFGFGSTCIGGVSENRDDRQESRSVEGTEADDNLIDSIPDCEVKRFVLGVAAEFQRKVDKRGLGTILKKMVCENWLEQMSHLENLSTEDWTRLELPLQLSQLLQRRLQATLRGVYETSEVGDKDRRETPTFEPSGSNNIETDPPSDPIEAQPSDAAACISYICSKKGVSKADEERAIQIIVNDNWYNTAKQLCSLSSSQWDILGLPESLRSILPAAVMEYCQDQQSVLREAIFKVGASLGRSPRQLEMSLERLERHGKLSLEDVMRMTESDWAQLQLPLRLYEELRNLKEPAVEKTIPGETSVKGDQIVEIKKAVPSQENDARVISSREERDQKMMNVERLIRKVGHSAGKTPEELQPIFDRLIRVHWLDTIESLRQLKPHEWADIGVPKRLVESIKKGLYDPFILEYNLVQFTAPDPDLFPSEVIPAVWKLESEIPANALDDTLRSMIRLMETLLCNLFDESKRVIRKANVNFEQRAGRYKCALQLLRAVGYVEAGDVWMLPVAYVTRLTQAHAALAQLAQLQRDRLSGKKKARPSSSSSSSGFAKFLSKK